MTVLDNPLYRPLLEALRSARNGVVYGGKLRFSHALVINLLYRLGPLKPRLTQVIQATKSHAEVLAAFATIYQLAVKVLLHDQVLGGSKGLVKFLAGSFGAWIVYSQHFPYFHPGITHQITLYCFSRVLLASGKIALDKYLHCAQPTFTIGAEKVAFRDLTDHQKKKLKHVVYNSLWKYFAVATWGLVMLFYDTHPQYLQSSLRHSMAYIYDVEMESWSTWREFLGL